MKRLSSITGRYSFARCALAMTNRPGSVTAFSELPEVIAPRYRRWPLRTRSPKRVDWFAALISSMARQGGMNLGQEFWSACASLLAKLRESLPACYTKPLSAQRADGLHFTS